LSRMRVSTTGPMQSTKVLSLQRMARRVGVPAKWLKEQAEAGSVPSLRAGAKFVFEPGAVEEALARLARYPTASGGAL
jgi:hypothetical protein